MPGPKTRHLTGITSFRDPDAGTTMASVEDLAITHDRVTHRIAPLGDDASAQLIVSFDRSVIRYQHRIANARAVNQYRLLAPRAVEKPEPTRRPMMVCPLCSGTREEDTGEARIPCRQCSGSGRVRQS